MALRTLTPFLFAALLPSVRATPFPYPQDNSPTPVNATTPGSFNTAADLVAAAVEAVGGTIVLNRVDGLVYNAPNLYRSRTVVQNYNLAHSDQSVASSGSQTISFDFSGDELQARVDRAYDYDDYWYWSRPFLTPSYNFTYVLRDGPGGYAYFTHGQNSFYASDPSEALGIADDYLADYLIHHAQMFALPGLLTQFQLNNSSLVLSEVVDPITNMSFQAVGNTALNITLVLSGETNLPYMIRSLENHAIFGASTNDVVLGEYKPVQLGDSTQLLLPHRFQTVYNSVNVLEDFLVESIILNPDFPPSFFDPPASNGTPLAATASLSPEYGRAEVHELFETGIWAGTFNFNVSDVVSSMPIPEVPQIRSVFIGRPDYAQLVIEFEDGVLVTDAPAHRSKILIQWVRETLGKEVKYVAPSHHHHDHAYGIGDYAAAGAILVVPEVAADYYENVNNGDVSIITYTEKNPFVLKDSNVQFRAIYRAEPPHAKDWTYGVATKACPGRDDKVVAHVADVWIPGPQTNVSTNLAGARLWLNGAVQDGLPHDTIIVGAHGSTQNGTSTTDVLRSLLEVAAYQYPNLTAQDWKSGGPFC